MSTVFIGLVILLYSLQSLFCAIYGKNYDGRQKCKNDLFNAVEGAIIAGTSLFFIKFQFHPSATTWIIGLLTGLMLLVYNTFFIKGSTAGPYSMLNISLLFGGLLIPIIYNAVALHTRVSYLQLIAIGLMLAALVLMNLKKEEMQWSKGFFFCCLLLFISNGAYNTLIKIQTSICESESTQMVILAFGVVSIVSTIKLLFIHKVEKQQYLRIGKRAWLSLLACSICAVTAINLLVYVLPLVNLAVLYTVENGGIMVMSVFFSFFIFKEKIAAARIIGILIAITSLVLLSV